MSNQLRCAEIVEAGKPLKIVSRDQPPTPEEGASLRTLFAGICHSDVHILDDDGDMGDGNKWSLRETLGEDKFKGMVMGHEIVGEITSLGSKSNASEHDLSVGDKVIVYPWIGCGNCKFCVKGYTNVCPELIGMFGDIGVAQEYLGGYSSHVRVPQLKYAVKVPADFPEDIACLLACSGLTAYCALKKVAESVSVGQVVRGHGKLMVIGVGGLGLWCIKLAKVMYPGMKIVGVDVAQEKLTVAHSNGSDIEYLWETKAPIEEIAEKLKLEEIDAVVDFVGTEQTTTLSLMTVHKMATVVIVGLRGGKLNYPIVGLISESVSLRGSIVGTLQDMRELVQLVSQHKIRYTDVKFCKQENVSETLDKLRIGKVLGRTIIRY